MQNPEEYDNYISLEVEALIETKSFLLLFDDIKDQKVVEVSTVEWETFETRIDLSLVVIVV